MLKRANLTFKEIIDTISVFFVGFRGPYWKNLSAGMLDLHFAYNIKFSALNVVRPFRVMGPP